jgi:DNA-binding transcriptional ArsR family regulator
VDDMQEVFESVARYFGVLGEPTRLRILHALCQDEKCVNDIIQATGLAQANASRHLGLMYQAGMLSRRRDGTQIFYKVADPMYIELCRTVSIQLIGRSDNASVKRDSLSHFADEMTPRASGKRSTQPQPPAIKKEQASV